MAREILHALPRLDSTATRQLRDGFPWLRFADRLLEGGFKQHHFAQARIRVQIQLWLSIALVMTFIFMDDFALYRAHSAQLLGIRVLALGSLLIGALLALKATWYERYYPQWVCVMAPLFGVCVVLNELIDQPSGVSFFAAIILAVFAIYLLIGMLFVSALASGLFILLAYLCGALLSGLPDKQLLYNGTILLFTNVLGATASYNFERLIRSSFLEAQLLNDMANRDGLTGIYNRRAFDEHTNRVWQQALHEHRQVALLLIDIDYFKAYNDYYGHQVGDQCLQQVSAVLSAACLRPTDFVARYGGEEFVVVLYDAPVAYVAEVATHIQTALHQLGVNHPAAPARQLTVSIGAACVLPEARHSMYGCIQLADEALYAAKEAGRDRVVIKDGDCAELTAGSLRHTDCLVEHSVSR